MTDVGSRSSRYWLGAREYQRLAAAIVVLVLAGAYFEEGSTIGGVVGELMLMFGTVGSVIYAGAAWVNRSERSPEFQEAVARREAQQRAPTAPSRHRPTAPRVDVGPEQLGPPVARGRP